MKTSKSLMKVQFLDISARNYVFKVKRFWSKYFRVVAVHLTCCVFQRFATCWSGPLGKPMQCQNASEHFPILLISAKYSKTFWNYQLEACWTALCWYQQRWTSDI